MSRAAPQPLPLGVLVSGSGTNLQALIDACGAPGFPARVAHVVSNVPGAKALERAAKAGIPSTVVEHGRFASRAEFERALVAPLRAAGVQLVCLAGFMRLVGKEFLSAFPAGVLNIHPALLPSFPGLHAQRQALTHGVKVTGCTVHFVDEGTDTGPILAQAAVPILDADDEAALSARIQAEEHRLYVEAVRAVAEGRVRVDGRRVYVASR